VLCLVSHVSNHIAQVGTFCIKSNMFLFLKTFKNNSHNSPYFSFVFNFLGRKLEFFSIILFYQFFFSLIMLLFWCIQKVDHICHRNMAGIFFLQVRHVISINMVRYLSFKYFFQKKKIFLLYTNKLSLKNILTNSNC